MSLAGDLGPALEELSRDGWAVLPARFDSQMCNDLAAETLALVGDPEAVDAGVGRGPDRTLAAEVRRARIRWLDGTTPAQQQFLVEADAIRTALNRHLFLGLQSFEAQLALTPPGGFYRRHLDSFRGNRNRIVSLVAYLTPDWRREYGGQLRVWPSPTSAVPTAAMTDIVPYAGTMVLMLSEEIAHEVLPCSRPRASLAGWFRLQPIEY